MISSRFEAAHCGQGSSKGKEPLVLGSIENAGLKAGRACYDTDWGFLSRRESRTESSD